MCFWTLPTVSQLWTTEKQTTEVKNNSTELIAGSPGTSELNQPDTAVSRCLLQISDSRGPPHPLRQSYKVPPVWRVDPYLFYVFFPLILRCFIFFYFTPRNWQFHYFHIISPILSIRGGFDVNVYPPSIDKRVILDGLNLINFNPARNARFFTTYS